MFLFSLSPFIGFRVRGSSCFFLLYFRWMVDREVDRPVWVVLGPSWGLCVRSWAALGIYVGGLGAGLGLMLAILSCSWASKGGSGPVLAALRRLLAPMLAILGRSWASTGGPGPLLGPLCAVRGRSWSLCWRSCSALGAYVGGLGPLLGPMLAVVGCS